MNNIIIVRYSEIFLKSEFVRNQLEGKLADNIRNGIKRNEIDAKVKRERGRIFIETEQLKEVADLLAHVFGIASFSKAVKIKLKNLENFVKENCKTLLPEKTFAVRVSRTGSHDFTSQELAARLGEIIIDVTGKKVDLSNPDNELFVEVRDEESFIFIEKFSGPGGMSLNSQGGVNCFVNSKEGLVACWLMMKRGCITNVYYTIPIDILDNWSYGVTLKKIKVKDIDDIPTDLPLVAGNNLEKDGIEIIKKYGEKFQTILSPVIAFKEMEIDEFLGKIKT